MLDILKKIVCVAYDIGGFAGVGITALVLLLLLMYFISGREGRIV